jgi:hypothetical protein
MTRSQFRRPTSVVRLGGAFSGDRQREGQHDTLFEFGLGDRGRALDVGGAAERAHVLDAHR